MPAVYSRKYRLAALAFGLSVTSTPQSALLRPVESDAPGLTFGVRPPGFSYGKKYRSIRTVDFRNFTMISFDPAGRLLAEVALRKGHYELTEELFRDSVDILGIHYLRRSGGSNPVSALVLSSWWAAGGSSSQFSQAGIFALQGGALRVIQEFSWDTHFTPDGPTESFDPLTQTLVVRSAHRLNGDAHCCVSAQDAVTFRWNGNQFVLASVNTQLTDFGKSEGKALPR